MTHECYSKVQVWLMKCWIERLKAHVWLKEVDWKLDSCKNRDYKLCGMFDFDWCNLRVDFGKKNSLFLSMKSLSKAWVWLMEFFIKNWLESSSLTVDLLD